MSKLNLLFFIFALIALSTASVERNLRFLGEENERELEGSDTDPDNESSAATTPQTTTKTETAATTTESTTTTASSSGDSTTTSASDPSDTTTPSTEKPDDGDGVPPAPEGTFRCYVKEAPEYVKDTGFKVNKLFCDIPEPTTTPESTSETTTTPAETTTGAAARMLAEGGIEVTIEGKTNVKCTGQKAADNKPTKLTCKTGEVDGFNNTDYRFTAVYSTEYKSVVYVGCKLGNSVIIPAGKNSTGEKCPDPLIGDDAYNTTCEFNISKIDIGNEFRLTNNEMVCMCGNSVKYNDTTYTFTQEDISRYNNVVGTPDFVEKKCKKSGKIVFQCKSTGWEYIKGGDSCNDDGAISSTVSSILLGVIMILAIVF